MLPEHTVFFYTNIGDTYQVAQRGLKPLPQPQWHSRSITELRGDICGKIHILDFDTLADFKTSKPDNFGPCCGDQFTHRRVWIFHKGLFSQTVL